MSYNSEKLGAFIVPTGVGASIGGYAGDASVYARKFSKKSNLIVNPNVVNAGGFSGITENMLYTEGYTLDSFFKGEVNLIPSVDNKIGIIYDKAIPQDVLNIHLNTQNAVKTVYGTNIKSYTITDEEVGVEFYVTDEGISTGNIKNISTLEKACQNLLSEGCDAIAIVCLFNDAEEDNLEYSQGSGVDPVGGVEAVISHYISMKFKVPCAHSPAPTFLPCILLGLSQAPKITTDLSEGINISDVDYLVMPYNSLGSIPVFEAEKRGIKTYAVVENKTVLDVTKDKLYNKSSIIEIATYDEILATL